MFVYMFSGLGEGFEVGASAPTSTNSTVLHSFPHARIGSTSSITGRASTSPIRARLIINAIGAGGLPACQLAFWSTSSQLGPLRPNHASSELAPACLANRPSCTVEAACCLDRAAWLSVVAANMRSWPVLTQPRGPTGRRPKDALNSAQTGESAADVCNYSR